MKNWTLSNTMWDGEYVLDVVPQIQTWDDMFVYQFFMIIRCHSLALLPALSREGLVNYDDIY